MKYKSEFGSGWFQYYFSVADINDDGISDLIAGQGNTTRIHFGSSNGIDTIPSFVLADPDINRHDFGGSNHAFNIGDFNKDGYNDFILEGPDFTLHLGGTHLSNYNPYGIHGLPGVFGYPDKAIPVGDQNEDGVDDFAACTLQYYFDIDAYAGAVEILYGQDNIHTDVKEKTTSPIKEFELYQNYPNPFNPSTVISYQLSVVSEVKLKIYDSLGRQMATLINQEQQGGKHEIKFNAELYNLSSGIYFYQLIVTTSKGEYKSEKKMMMIK